MLGQILRNKAIHNSLDPVVIDQTVFMNEISSCKDTTPIGTMKSLLCLKCQLVEMYVNKGLKMRWTVSFDA
jgi:hypothetical protein